MRPRAIQSSNNPLRAVVDFSEIRPPASLFMSILLDGSTAPSPLHPHAVPFNGIKMILLYKSRLFSHPPFSRAAWGGVGAFFILFLVSKGWDRILSVQVLHYWLLISMKNSRVLLAGGNVLKIFIFFLLHWQWTMVRKLDIHSIKFNGWSKLLLQRVSRWRWICMYLLYGIDIG